MAQDLNNVDFINFIKNKITTFILSYFEYENKNELDNLINDFKIFYLSLFHDKLINDDNKKNILQFFDYENKNFLKKWLITHIVDCILKIYKDKIDINLLIDNNYFNFKILANKEYLKNILDKYYTLDSLNMNLAFKVLQKNLNINNDDNEKVKHIVTDFYQDIYEIFNIDEKDRNPLNYFFVNFDIRRKIIFEYEDRYIDYIVDKSFFVKKNNMIMFSDFFKKFINIIFNFNVKEKNLIINNNEKDKLLIELEEAISITPV